MATPATVRAFAEFFRVAPNEIIETIPLKACHHESRPSDVSGGGFEQAYNAPAAVDVASMLVVAPWLTQAPNDKEQVAPMLEQIGQLPAGLGTSNQLLADTGSFSAKHVNACEAVKIEPLIAIAGSSARQFDPGIAELLKWLTKQQVTPQ